MVATWDDPLVQWDDPKVSWDGESPLLEGVLYANVAGTWTRAEQLHPQGREAAGWQEPWELWANDGNAFYASWPRIIQPTYPAPSNFRVTAVTATTATLAWDALVPAPLRYWVQVPGAAAPAPTGGTSQVVGNLTPATAYTADIWACYADGNTPIAHVAFTSGANPPTITNWQPLSWNVVRLTTSGDAPLTLRCVGGARNGQTFGWGPLQDMTLVGGTEYWQMENPSGVSGRFYTVTGTQAQSGVTGSINTTLAAPTAMFGRGSCTGIDWGVPAMAPHPNFPYANCTDGTGASRWQTGNYPRGWVQFQVGVETGYRVRRFMLVCGDGNTGDETVCPVYSVDGGASFKRWSHGFGSWIAWDTGGVTPDAASGGNSLLGISPQGSWDRDWNWRGAPGVTTPYIPENGTDLTQRWIFVRWGLVHLTGSFGANIGECWMEYQTPSTPAVAEVFAGIAWG